ncbi:MAG: ATP-binding protein [bacterium]
MTVRNWLAGKARYRALPYAAGILVFSLSVAFAITLQRRENADIERAAMFKARALAGLTANSIGNNVKELVRLASSWQANASSRIAWESAALRAIEVGEFRSIAWVDTSGRTVAAVPDESGAIAPLEPRFAAVRAEMARAARATGRVSTSAPLFSDAGISMIVSAVPTARGDAAIVGESALPSLLQQSIDEPEALGYSFALSSGSRELYARIVGTRALEERWAQDAYLTDVPGGWRIRAWPTSAELAQRNSHLPEAMFLAGVIFATCTTGMMLLFQMSDRRAFALSAANTRLEDEIGERERAQLALEQSEEQLRQSQKMEAVGRLAGGIAHDFNNLLTAINGYADFLLADIERGDPRRDDVREIKKAATRAGALTTQLLAFSRRQIRQPRSLDLNAVLTDLDRMLCRVIGEDVTINWRPSERLGTVKADPSEIEQVLLNLVVNAGDAMPNGGTITVTTSTVEFEGVTARPQLPPGLYVRLIVSDTGMGMNAVTRERIFEPFFTTKGPGKGTGLGLSTVYAIVQNLKGAIEVESAVGKGTTFTVYLPRHEAPADLIGSGTMATLAPRGVETVLLVEDEEGVRALGARILERHGYTVIEARNGRDALAVVSQHVGHIDLLLTDVVMPEMGGKQLAEALVARDAAIRVLFISGYTDGDISRRGELDPCTAFLQKPFTARGLLGRVREVLDGVEAAA